MFQRIFSCRPVRIGEQTIGHAINVRIDRVQVGQRNVPFPRLDGVLFTQRCNDPVAPGSQGIQTIAGYNISRLIQTLQLTLSCVDFRQGRGQTFVTIFQLSGVPGLSVSRRLNTGHIRQGHAYQVLQWWR